MRPGETPITLFGSLKLGPSVAVGALGCSLVSLVVNPALAFPEISGWVLLQNLFIFLAHDAFVRTNHHAVSIMFVRLSVCDGCAAYGVL